MANKIVISYTTEAGSAAGATNALTNALGKQKNAAQGAAEGLTSLRDILRQLASSAKGVASGLESIGKSLEPISKSVKEAVASFKPLSANAEKAAKGIAPLAKEMKALATSSDKAATGIKELTGELPAVKESAKDAGKSVADANRRISRSAGGIGGAFRNIGGKIKGSISNIIHREAKKSMGALGKLGASIKRIVFYRAIRSAIRAVTQSFREGTSNLYQYSAALNSLDAARAKNTMDGFASTALYVKNSLGAMLMPVLTALLPVINAVADAFVTAANAVNQFFQAIRGGGTFTKAKKQAVEFGDALGGAAGKAKELKKQTFGFDELNIFSEPSGGGGGGGGGMDYSGMFEEADVSPLFDKIKALTDLGLYRKAGETLAEGLNEIVAQFDAVGFGEKIGSKITAGLQFIAGAFTALDFKQLGTKVADGVNGIVSKLKLKNLGEIIARWFTAGIDFFIGFVTTFDAGAAAAAVRDAFIGFFDHLSDWIKTVDWKNLGETFFNLLKDAITNINLGEIASSLFTFLGEAVVAAVNLLTGFLGSVATTVKDYFTGKMEECGGSAGKGILKGILDAIKGIFKWVYNNVIKPFVDAIKSGFGIGGDDDSTKMKDIGKKIINGLLAGLKETFTKITTWVTEKVNWIKNMFKSVDASSPRQLDYGGGGGNYQAFASGGYPETGSFFLAGEAGPELVGTVGGRTTVTSHDQFTAGMEDIMDNTNTVIMQAAQALISAIQNKDMTAVVSIGDRQIVSAYDRGKRLAGVGLVE